MTAPDELTKVRFQLVLGGEAAARLANHLEDLRDQAYLRHAGGGERVSGGDVDEDGGRLGVETVGDARARRLWGQLVVAAAMVDEMPVLERSVLNYFMAGRGAGDEYRGSLVSKGEFVNRVRNQRRQAAAGEHVPFRLVDQPPYPGSGR